MVHRNKWTLYNLISKLSTDSIPSIIFLLLKSPPGTFM
jgi:hypothetical protein